MGRTMVQIMLICLIGLASTRSSASSASRSINDRLKQMDNSEDSKSPMKKAYTYVSEYKRLPVFNFGIGKRWASANGLKGSQRYSFGFGKRSEANVYPLRMGLDYIPYDNTYENYMNDDMQSESKPENKRAGRVRQYDFGVGKRFAPHSAAALMDVNRDENEAATKHLNEDLEQSFLYGLSNRFAENQEEGLEAE